MVQMITSPVEIKKKDFCEKRGSSFLLTTHKDRGVFVNLVFS